MALGEEQLGAPGIWRLIVVLSVAGLILVSISHRHRDVDDDDDDDDDVDDDDDDDDSFDSFGQ